MIYCTVKYNETFTKVIFEYEKIPVSDINN